MKIPSPILGVLVALVAGMLMLSIHTANNETRSIIFGCILIVPVSYFGIKYRIKASKDERLASNGLNHYRQHIHQRKLIKKTS